MDESQKGCLVTSYILDAICLETKFYHTSVRPSVPTCVKVFLNTHCAAPIAWMIIKLSTDDLLCILSPMTMFFRSCDLNFLILSMFWCIWTVFFCVKVFGLKISSESYLFIHLFLFLL